MNMQTKLYTSFIVLLGIIQNLECLVIDGCPLFGCRPSGSFSFYLQVPRENVSFKWSSSFVLDPVPNALGCVADSVNIICPSNGPFSEDKGYISLFIENGTIRWRDRVLHFPTLPLLDNYGDVTGSDGEKLVHYDRDGKLYPIIKCYGLNPMFSMQLVGTMYLLLVGEQGGLVVRDTNAIPVAEIFLNDTVQRTNGTFLPISQPVVNGQRFYLLTEFVPESENFDPSVLNLQRLYAIDIHHRPADIMTIAWSYNFEMESPTNDEIIQVSRNEKIMHIKNSIQKQQNLLWDYATQGVYVSLPPPYMSNRQSTFWGFRDEGNDTALTIRSPLDVSHLATFEADSDNVRHHDGGKQSGSYLWISTADSRLCTIKSDGNVSRTINVNSIFGTDVVITSKLALVRQNDTADDILIFGAKVTKQTDSFRKVVASFSNTNINETFYVVAIDTSSPTGHIMWMQALPDGYEVKGQITGFSGAAYQQKDQLVFYADNGKSAKIFSIN
ncbi:uncharacterized protein LOC132752309 [Ruditapes philippinarum]|uniref:uncharacterized protein LOC132752309 n=1 Tax=Ruditapes philippinarum TaxID=129788 RepID=UPI00295BA0AF|nr:uncharacterized protein LOC132752309 [Ruditapes philippinarum]